MTEKLKLNRLLILKLHIVFWFLKDCFWCLQWATLSKIMIIPTIILTIILLRIDRENRIENLAITSWILMNALWLLHEMGNHLPKFWCYIPMLFAVLFTILLAIKKEKNEKPKEL
jgi:hypothetical protein